MRLLLDTHTLMWWWLADPKLSTGIRRMIGDRRNQVNVSASSAWEIATKVRLGKLPEMSDHIRSYDQLVTDDGFIHLAITHDHAVRSGLMEGSHGDPFDRMIAAQALILNLAVVTCDREMAAFGCEVIW